MRVVLALFLVFLCALPAQANDNIFLRDVDPDTPDAQRLEEALGLKDKQNPEELNGPMIAAYYYTECLKEPDMGVSDSTQKSLCTCTSTQMKEQMNVEEMRMLFLNTKHGKDARSLFKRYIYGPCMEGPVRDIITQACAQSEDLGQKLRNGSAVCRCLGEKMGEYAGQRAATLLNSQEHTKTPYSMAALISNKHFIRKSEPALRSCVVKFHYGWK